MVYYFILNGFDKKRRVEKHSKHELSAMHRYGNFSELSCFGSMHLNYTSIFYKNFTSHVVECTASVSWQKNMEILSLNNSTQSSRLWTFNSCVVIYTICLAEKNVFIKICSSYISLQILWKMPLIK